MEDKSLGDSDDPKMTSNDIVSVKHLKSTFEGIQNLGGGTDIKVHYLLYFEMTMVCLYIFFCKFPGL